MKNYSLSIVLLVTIIGKAGQLWMVRLCRDLGKYWLVLACVGLCFMILNFSSGRWMGPWKSKQSSAETIFSSAGQIQAIRKWLCWDGHPAATLQLRVFPRARGRSMDAVWWFNSHTTTSWWGTTFALPCRKEERTSISMPCCSQKGHHHFRLLYFSVFFRLC